jgi:hypothetical protein
MKTDDLDYLATGTHEDPLVILRKLMPYLRGGPDLLHSWYENLHGPCPDVVKEELQKIQAHFHKVSNERHRINLLRRVREPYRKPDKAFVDRIVRPWLKKKFNISVRYISGDYESVQVGQVGVGAYLATYAPASVPGLYLRQIYSAHPERNFYPIRIVSQFDDGYNVEGFFYQSGAPLRIVIMGWDSAEEKFFEYSGYTVNADDGCQFKEIQ